MTRRLLVVVAFSLVVVGCGSAETDSDVAAVVNGVDIPAADLEAVILEGSSGGEIADALRRLITNQVLESAVAERGLLVTPEAEQLVRASIVADATATSGLSLDEVLAASGLTDAAFDLIVRQSALAEAVEVYLAENAPPPRDSDLQQVFDEEVANRTNVCSAHILLTTESEALAALDRAMAGEDFGDLAMELSTGPSGPTGGDLGCSNPGQYVAPFAAATLEAEIQVPYGPVETQFGFHVILVTAREIPTLDDLREELIARLLGDVFPVWLSAEIAAATVVVNPDFGIWDADLGGIVPPG